MLDPVTATALSKAIAGGLSRLGGQQLADRVAALTHIQRTEIKLLTEIRQDVDRLVAEPFVTAGLLLSDASQPHRSDDDRHRLLHEARGSLTRALAVDSEPLRLSAASLLLAGVWMALDSPEDAPALIRNAHEHAVQAALALADTPRPPLSEGERLPVAWRLLAPLPRVTWRRAAKDRPRSLRVRAVTTATTLGFDIAQVEQFVSTNRARADERALAAINGYVREIRELRLNLGEAADAVPEFQVRLLPTVSATQHLPGLTTRIVFYALAYAEVEAAEGVAAPDQLPSNQFSRLAGQLFPKRN